MSDAVPRVERERHAMLMASLWKSAGLLALVAPSVTFKDPKNDLRKGLNHRRSLTVKLHESVMIRTNKGGSGWRNSINKAV
jgi:uncharacterized protein (DUF4415 family)